MLQVQNKMLLDSDDELLLPEVKFIAQNINMLDFEIKFMLENCAWSLMPCDLYNAAYDVKKSVQKMREVYVNSLRFTKTSY